MVNITMYHINILSKKRNAMNNLRGCYKSAIIYKTYTFLSEDKTQQLSNFMTKLQTEVATQLYFKALASGENIQEFFPIAYLHDHKSQNFKNRK